MLACLASEDYVQLKFVFFGSDFQMKWNEEEEIWEEEDRRMWVRVTIDWNAEKKRNEKLKPNDNIKGVR